MDRRSFLRGLGIVTGAVIITPKLLERSDCDDWDYCEVHITANGGEGVRGLWEDRRDIPPETIYELPQGEAPFARFMQENGKRVQTNKFEWRDLDN